MHRDNHRYGSGSRRGLSSKQFLWDLHDRGVGRDDAIQAVSQMFGAPRVAARLFVLAHPAWADDDDRPMSVPWIG
jgi:hypothetical protein